jgi:cold shock CspA family protein
MATGTVKWFNARRVLASLRRMKAAASLSSTSAPFERSGLSGLNEGLRSATNSSRPQGGKMSAESLSSSTDPRIVRKKSREPKAPGFFAS